MKCQERVGKTQRKGGLFLSGEPVYTVQYFYLSTSVVYCMCTEQQI